MSTQPNISYTQATEIRYGRHGSGKVVTHQVPSWDETYADTPNCAYWERQAGQLDNLLKQHRGEEYFAEFAGVLFADTDPTWMQYTLWMRAALDLAIRNPHLTPAELAVRAMQATCQHVCSTGEIGDEDDRRKVARCVKCGFEMSAAISEELDF